MKTTFNPAFHQKSLTGFSFVTRRNGISIDFSIAKLSETPGAFAPLIAIGFPRGQLGIVRVGIDRRTLSQLSGNRRLEAGVYALCEVESEAFDGTGANGEFWAPGQGREPGWSSVALRYLRTYRHDPLTIKRLRNERPDLSTQLLNGFEATSFPIAPNDFRAVMFGNIKTE